MSNSVFNLRDLSKNINDRILLGCADSIHDFDDEGGRVDNGAWSGLDNLLKRNLNKISPQSNSPTYTDWLKKNISSTISASNVEEQTNAYYEEKYKEDLKMDFVKTITYRDIINAIESDENQGTTINQKIYNAGYHLFGEYFTTSILEVDIAVDEDWNVSYSTRDKIYIGLFLLNYFFPPSVEDENSKLPSYITFDAGSNIPSKIFGLLDQVINLVTPLNIADSALGENHLIVDKSQKRLSIKNKYEFPINSPDNVFTYNSNIYTRDVNILYIKKPNKIYNETNKYDFNISINSGPNIEFNSEHKSGPSVKYLSNLIAGQPAYIEGKMVDLSTLNGYLNNDKSLLLDLKRSGDWEQCNAAYAINKLMPGSLLNNRVILCTIDRLCALYSRCIGQNTILHYGTRLKLYRFPGKISQEQIEQIKIKQEQILRIEEENTLKVINYINTALNTAFLRISEGFKNSAVIGLKILKKKEPVDILILNIITKLLEKSLEKYNNIYKNNIGNKNYFKELSILTNQNITVYNYEPYVDYINNIKSLEKIKFCYYEYKEMHSLHELLNSLYNFNIDIHQKSRSLNTKNYKNELLKNGFFEIIEKIENVLYKDEETRFERSPAENMLFSLKEINYNIANVEIGKENLNYYSMMQRAIQSITIGIIGTNPNYRGGIKKMYGGEITEIELQNATYNLTTEFVSLCCEISEITENIVNRPNDLVQYDFNTFIETIKPVLSISGKTTTNKINIVKNIDKIINNYFENSFNILKEISENSDIPINLKTNYLYIYIIFSLLYNYEKIMEIDKYRYIINGIIQTNNILSDQINKFAYYELIQYLFANYNPIYLPINYNILDVDNTLYFLIQVIVRLKFKYQNEKIENNTEIIILIIFTFFQNYLKYIISKKTKVLQHFTADVTHTLTGTAIAGHASNYGYYIGLLNDFNSHERILDLFNKLYENYSREYISQQINDEMANIGNFSWENEQYEKIFLAVDKTFFHLLLYLLNPKASKFTIRELSIIRRGGKKSKKNKKIKKSKKGKKGKKNLKGRKKTKKIFKK